jgi:UDP-N-acetylmuramate dehydrogenase
MQIKRMNSWRLGSTVRFYLEPKTEAELITQVKSVPETKHGLLFLGLGSNVLFPDHELDAVLVRMRHLNHYTIDGDIFDAQVGLTLAKIGKKAIKLGMCDAGFLVGIPGMLGGALVMNAGAQGRAIWDFVQSVRVLTDQGIIELFPEDFCIGYRNVIAKKYFVHCFLSAKLKFEITCPIIADASMRSMIQKRNAAQPIGTYNCGCVFKNLPDQSIGILLDQLGFRGRRFGGARVSPKHANFIENHLQQATTKDVLNLIQIMQDAVYAATQYQPQLEVKIYD